MALPLFRAEAIAFHRATIWGGTTLPPPPSLYGLSLFLAACVMAGACFLTCGSYTRKEHVLGFLQPQHGVARIVSPRSGTIAALQVREGTLVHQGDTLLTISAGQTDSHGQDVDAALLGELRQQHARIMQQIGLEQQNATARRRAIEANIRGLELLVAALQTEHVLQAQRASLAATDLAAITGLVREGEMSAVELRRRQDNSLLQKQAESGMWRAILDKQAEIRAQRSQLAELTHTSADRITSIENEAAELGARIAGAEGQRAYQIRAPISGRVSALQAWVGKPVDPAMLQMSIVPEGDTLQAAVLVPPRAIGFIVPGQHVRLSYDSFPSQSFGFGQGVVESVSHTLLKPGEIDGPILAGQPAYRITVRLASQSLHANGTEIPLQTDAALQADILLDTHSLFAWLTAPLWRVWGAQ
jgi:membrane fusion protein